MDTRTQYVSGLYYQEFFTMHGTIDENAVKFFLTEILYFVDIFEFAALLAHNVNPHTKYKLKLYFSLSFSLTSYSYLLFFFGRYFDSFDSVAVVADTSPVRLYAEKPFSQYDILRYINNAVE